MLLNEASNVGLLGTSGTSSIGVRLLTFLDSNSDSFTTAMVVDWIESLRSNGPPVEGARVRKDDDLYLVLVPRTRLSVATS